ncbi:MAG: trigger factor, partial [Desulfatibacillaceae bacterium]|nr:trigger factor [Desulfatibacillaceae bacterium]
FRPGKAPRSVVERIYKEDIMEDVRQKLVSESLPKALEETKLDIVGMPQADPPEPKKDEGYSFEAFVEIFPQIPEVDLSGLELEKPVYTASDEEIDNQLAMLRKSMGHLKALEEPRPAQKGDYILITYQDANRENPIQELEQVEDFSMELGSGKILAEFDDQIAGMNIGEEKTVPLTFPEDYSSKNLAGKQVQIIVKLNDIRQLVLPELDDELAKDFGQYENLEQLKQAIRENLQDGYNRRAEQALDEQLYKALFERVDFEVPTVMVQHEVAYMIRDAERALEYRNISMEDVGMSRETLAVRYMEPATHQVKRHLLLDKIGKQENLVLDEGALDKAYADMSQSLGQSAETIKSYYQKDAEQLEALKGTLLQKQTLEYIKSKAQITEKPAKPDTEQEPE